MASDSMIGIAWHASLSPVEFDDFAYMQTADSKFVDLDNAKPRPPDRQAVNKQATDGERANRDCSYGESSDCESADALGLGRLGTDCLSADCYGWRASRAQAFFRVFLHMEFCMREGTNVHFARRVIVRKESDRRVRESALEEGRLPWLT
jgi:hypothetical protein